MTSQLAGIFPCFWPPFHLLAIRVISYLGRSRFCVLRSHVNLGRRGEVHIWLIPALISNDPGPREHDWSWLLQFSFSVASEGIDYPRSGHLNHTLRQLVKYYSGDHITGQFLGSYLTSSLRRNSKIKMEDGVIFLIKEKQLSIHSFCKTK